MSEDALATIARKLELADKLIRWQMALFALIVSGAVWSASMNFRVTAIETERSRRLPIFDEWKAATDIELANHDARLKNLEAKQ